MFRKTSFLILTALIAGELAIGQTAPKIGTTLKESVPYTIDYNKKPPKDAPNVIWVLIDDAGFGATTPFGGLVETPNFDRLAKGGLRYTNFHTTGICSPTRAALLTGRNHHSVHMGLLTPAAIGFPGYDSYIPFEKATAAEVLRENGYATFALGKWHLTPVVENAQAGPFDRWPLGRGFDHFFGFLPGATDQWHPELWEGNTKLDIETDGKHLNELLADKAIKYIANQKSVSYERPFFLYLATGATHSPHQVAESWIKKFEGQFDEGWDVYRERVFANQKKLGIIPENTVLPDRNPGVPAWAELTPKQRKAYARFMEVYAAFYAYTDFEIGRIIQYLEQIDQLDNTLIAVVLGDNGASKGGTQHGTISQAINQLRGEERIDAILAASDLIGSDQSYSDYPIGWAAATNTPFRYWKANANAEGGTRNPMILHYPEKIKDKGGIRHQYSHVIDLLPTTLELVNGKAPELIKGYKQEPFEGTSLGYTIAAPDAPARHTLQYFEIAGARAIYKDGWKAGLPHELPGIIPTGSKPDPSGGLVDFSKDKWELYNLNEDINERINLADQNPEKLEELKGVFDQEAKKYNIYPLKDFSAHDMPAGRTVFGKKKNVTLFPGVDNLVGVSSPLYEGRSFSVSVHARIESGNEEGVLFAIGGESSGVSLFIKNRQFHFTHKTESQYFEKAFDTDIPKGDVIFRWDYSANGKSEKLYLNGKLLLERKLNAGDVTITGNRHRDGTDVGRDQKFPVSKSYQAPFTFNGVIRKAEIIYK